MTEETQDKASDNKPKRDSKGRLLPGNTANQKGLTPETEQDKLVKKAKKQFIKDYIETLAEALPQISPALIKKAKTGDISAIRELNDRVLGKPKQNIEVEGELKIYQWGNGNSNNIQPKKMGDTPPQQQEEVEDSCSTPSSW